MRADPILNPLSYNYWLLGGILISWTCNYIYQWSFTPPRSIAPLLLPGLKSLLCCLRLHYHQVSVGFPLTAVSTAAASLVAYNMYEGACHLQRISLALERGTGRQPWISDAPTGVQLRRVSGHFTKAPHGAMREIESVARFSPQQAAKIQLAASFCCPCVR